jgi:predicted esterase YcpF (UPF0227 family)
MKRLLDIVGMGAGGWLGWWLGMHLGIVTAVVLSAVGSGAGLYFTRKWAERHLE